MPKLNRVVLTASDRQVLEEMLRQGRLSFRERYRASILLLADEGEADRAIAEEVEVHRSCVERTRKRFVNGGLSAALGERSRSGRPPRLDGKGEALVVALACSQAPEGRTRWTLRQLGERLVGMEVVETISHETVRRVLKKTLSSRGRSALGACPKSMVSSSGAWKKS